MAALRRRIALTPPPRMVRMPIDMTAFRNAGRNGGSNGTDAAVESVKSYSKKMNRGGK